jgi:hypothetical protein
MRIVAKALFRLSKVVDPDKSPGMPSIKHTVEPDTAALRCCATT